MKLTDKTYLHLPITITEWFCSRAAKELIGEEAATRHLTEAVGEYKFLGTSVAECPCGGTLVGIEISRCTLAELKSSPKQNGTFDLGS